MIAEPEGHRRGAPHVTAAVDRLGQRTAQGEVGAEPVVLELGQAEEGVPGGHRLREPVSLAGQAVEAIAQRPVETFEMDRVGQLRWRAKDDPDLESLQAAALAVLDRRVRATPSVGLRIFQFGFTREGSASR
jgi:hypothetical protein